MKKKLKFLVVEVQYLVAWTQKIIWNSKAYLINKLGGYTKELYNAKQTIHYDKGNYMAYYDMRDYMKSLNGLSKQEWIDKVWTHVNNKINEPRY